MPYAHWTAIVGGTTYDVYMNDSFLPGKVLSCPAEQQMSSPTVSPAQMPAAASGTQSGVVPFDPDGDSPVASSSFTARTFPSSLPSSIRATMRTSVQCRSVWERSRWQRARMQRVAPPPGCPRAIPSGRWWRDVCWISGCFRSGWISCLRVTFRYGVAALAASAGAPVDWQAQARRPSSPSRCSPTPPLARVTGLANYAAPLAAQRWADAANPFSTMRNDLSSFPADEAGLPGYRRRGSRRPWFFAHPPAGRIHKDRREFFLDGGGIPMASGSRHRIRWLLPAVHISTTKTHTVGLSVLKVGGTRGPPAPVGLPDQDQFSLLSPAAHPASRVLT